MTDQELELLLLQKGETLDLKQKSSDALEALLTDPDNKEEALLAGFSKAEVRPVFDGFEYQVDQRHSTSVIRTRIGPYVEDPQKYGSTTWRLSDTISWRQTLAAIFRMIIL